MSAKNSILIADDDKNICELVRLYLEKEGYKVTSVYDGDSILANVFREEYSMIILDIMMP
ncbi:MAG: response regulator, partial [Clostridia bacterium]|nr:response regulator [Clostridia bacterium]